MSMLTKTATLRRAALGASLCLAVASPLARADDDESDRWHWMVAPYVWAADISTDLQVRQPPPGGFVADTQFDGIVDDIDGAFQIHAEAKRDRFGIFTDFTYLGLASGTERPRFNTQSDLDLRLFELAGIWSVGSDPRTGLDVFAGLRYIDLDLTVRFDPTNPLFNDSSFKSGETYSDFMLGARYTWALSDRWELILRGDGSFGETEGTWNASAVATYRMTHGQWMFGYRYLTGELKAGDSSVDVTMAGPMIGYGFNF